MNKLQILEQEQAFHGLPLKIANPNNKIDVYKCELADDRYEIKKNRQFDVDAELYRLENATH